MNVWGFSKTTKRKKKWQHIRINLRAMQTLSNRRFGLCLILRSCLISWRNIPPVSVKEQQLPLADFAVTYFRQLQRGTVTTSDEAEAFTLILTLQGIDRQSAGLLQHDTNTSVWEPSWFSSSGLFSRSCLLILPREILLSCYKLLPSLQLVGPNLTGPGLRSSEALWWKQLFCRLACSHSIALQ